VAKGATIFGPFQKNPNEPTKSSLILNKTAQSGHPMTVTKKKSFILRPPGGEGRPGQGEGGGEQVVAEGGRHEADPPVLAAPLREPQQGDAKPTERPGVDIIKLFAAVSYDFCNKLECFPLQALPA
jgi:hypothetical protein